MFFKYISLVRPLRINFVEENVSVEDGNLVLSITDPNASLSTKEQDDKDFFLAKYIPSTNEVVIEVLESGYHNVKICDMNGKVLVSEAFNGANFSIPTFNIQSGLYIVCIESKNNQDTKKIIIN